MIRQCFSIGSESDKLVLDGDIMDKIRGLRLENIQVLKEKYKKMRENDTALTKLDMMMSAMRCNFLTPVDIQPEPIPNENGTIELNEDYKVSFKLIRNTSGEKFLIAFTDINEYKKWNKQPPKSIVMDYQGYEELILDRNAADGMVIDPFGMNIVFSKKVINVMRKERLRGNSKKMN